MVLRRILAIVSLAALNAELPLATLAQQAGSQQSAPAIRATTELVLVNVVARDKKGNLIRDLKREDFTVLEDGQKQQVSSFDFENIEELADAGQGFDNGTTGSSEGAAETSGAFTADDTDFNTFSADRKLLALQSLVQSVGKLSQKKSLIYFSNGISQSGVDNQSALRAATAAAVKANVAIYPIDVRGLQALPAGGEAQTASLHGQSAYSGASILNDLNSNAATQETLSTLAADTGGKAFFDSNDFSGVFSQVQKDTSAYYILCYTICNHLKDGRFPHIKMLLNRWEINLQYPPGY